MLTKTQAVGGALSGMSHSGVCVCVCESVGKGSLDGEVGHSVCRLS